MLNWFLHGACVGKFHMSYKGKTGLQGCLAKIASHNNGVYKSRDNLRAPSPYLSPRQDICLFCSRGHWTVADKNRQYDGWGYVDITVRCDQNCCNK